LENVIERAVILADQEYVTLDDLPANLREKSAGLIKMGLREQKSLEEVKNEYINEVLREVDGNKQRAAEILRITPKTLYRLERNKHLAVFASKSDIPKSPLWTKGQF
jgi:two-component system NtrC family response regulator